MNTQTITIPVGDSRVIRFLVNDQGGTALNLSGAQIMWVCSTSERDTSYLITKTITNGGIYVSNAANGAFNLIFNPPDTQSLGGKSLYHEVKIKEPDMDVYTIFSGQFNVSRSIVVFP